MCLGIEPIVLAGLAASLAGSGVSAYGAYRSNQEAERNAARIAAARNAELARAMKRNEDIARQSRDLYLNRQSEIQPEQSAQTQEEVTQDRQNQLASTLAAPAPEAVPIAGSAPEVVKSEIAKKLNAALTASLADAQRLGKVGGYGDFFFNEGIKNNSLSRDLGILSDFQKGNLGILPYSQDFAAFRARRPSSGIGEALQAGGQMLGAAGGAMAGSGGGVVGEGGWSTAVKPTWLRFRTGQGFMG